MQCTMARANLQSDTPPQTKWLKTIATRILFSVASGLAIITLFNLDNANLVAVSAIVFTANTLERQWHKFVVQG